MTFRASIKWDETQQKMVKQPIKKWEPILQEFVPIEEKDDQKS